MRTLLRLAKCDDFGTREQHAVPYSLKTGHVTIIRETQ